MDDLRDESKRINRLIALDKSTLPPDGGEEFNRLIFSASPYLIQHSDNPVDWYPWGEEAFERAVSENKPVFLSIGYSTCHWCHVMEHESFEDPEVAAVLNRTFVCIKVDREERPDIDEQYMAIAQLMTGSGGWPLNIFMSTDRKPFYAATYIPRHTGMGMPGIVDVFEYFDRLWLTDRKKLEDNSATAVAALESFFSHESGSLPDDGFMDQALKQLSEIYDGSSGGFGTAPKFPMPIFIDFMLNAAGKGSAEALKMVEYTLRSMRSGGIYDQIGFGFHRYSTDSGWLVPHFEKMLYDQALIAVNYLKAFQLTSERFYLQVAEEILSYVMAEMTSPDGGFYSGQDADTGGAEGSYYIWTTDEIETAIGSEDAATFCRLFDVTGRGNFEGANILNLQQTVEEFAAEQGIEPGKLEADIERWRKILLDTRDLRIRPFRDEKIITAWNGMMISAFAKGYAVTGKAEYLKVAECAANFILDRLTGPSERLMRSFHLDRQSETGFLDDYACFTAALVDLHQVTMVQAYLDKASFFAAEMLRLFAGEPGGALYDSGSDAEKLLVRHKSSHDGVVPSGNSTAAAVLLRIGRITGDTALQKAGEGILSAFMGSVRKQPINSLNYLVAYDCHVAPEAIITFSGEPGGLSGMISAAHRRFLPNLILRYGGVGDEGDFRLSDGTPAAWLCAVGACRPPVSSAEDLGKLLDEVI